MTEKDTGQRFSCGDIDYRRCISFVCAGKLFDSPRVGLDLNGAFMSVAEGDDESAPWITLVRAQVYEGAGVVLPNPEGWHYYAFHGNEIPTPPGWSPDEGE